MKVYADESLYCSLPIEDFHCGNSMRYDIFIRLAEDNFVKIAQGGANLRSEQIEAYRSKGVARLWLLKRDFKDYLRFSVRLGRTLKSHDTKDARKEQFLQRTSDLLKASVGVSFLNPGFVEQSMSIVESVVSILTDSQVAIEILNTTDTGGKDSIYVHSLAVSLYSSMIAQNLGWRGPSTLFNLASGSLFHDIGLTDLPQSIIQKTHFGQNAAERALYESHPERGAQILSAIPDIPDEVIAIVRQHHEDEVGKGYPMKLKRNRIYPLAKLVAVADEFVEALEGFSAPTKADVENVLKRMADAKDVLDASMVAALVNVFGQKPPVISSHKGTAVKGAA